MHDGIGRMGGINLKRRMMASWGFGRCMMTKVGDVSMRLADI
jgi:hypothetical protein